MVCEQAAIGRGRRVGQIVRAPELVRVGDKLINRQKIDHSIDRILELRANGLSQQQVAAQIGVDRTFVSRLESLGEVRTGRSIALIGFPLENKDELAAVAVDEGLEFVLLMTNDERWQFVRDRTGLGLLNEAMALLAEVRRQDAVILIGSRQRNKLGRGLVDNEVYAIDLGESPITGDKWVDPQYLRSVIHALRGYDRVP